MLIIKSNKIKMKKILLGLSILCFSCTLNAQKIVYDKITEALNKRIMYTDWTTINWASQAHQLEASMLLEGRDTSLMLNWQCKEMLGVERGAEIILTFSDGTQTVLQSKAFAVSGAGKVQTEHVSSSTMGIQVDAKGDLSVFVDKTLSNIRINTTSGVVDFPVSAQEAAKLNLLYEVFNTALISNKTK